MAEQDKSSSTQPTEKEKRDQRILDGVQKREDAIPAFRDTRNAAGTDVGRLAEQKFSDARIEIAQAIFDKNNDGIIQRSEFQAAVDPNKDGRVTDAELRKFDETIPESARTVVHDMLRLKPDVNTPTVEGWLGVGVAEDGVAKKTYATKDEALLDGLKMREEAIPDFANTRKNPGTDAARIAESKFNDSRRVIARALFDDNNDGKIDRNELKKLDADGNGMLSAEEIGAFDDKIPTEARQRVHDMLRIKPGAEMKTVESWLGSTVSEAPTTAPTTPPTSAPDAKGQKR
jgi:hypothetical protein